MEKWGIGRKAGLEETVGRHWRSISLQILEPDFNQHPHCKVVDVKSKIHALTCMQLDEQAEVQSTYLEHLLASKSVWTLGMLELKTWVNAWVNSAEDITYGKLASAAGCTISLAQMWAATFKCCTQDFMSSLCVHSFVLLGLLGAYSFCLCYSMCFPSLLWKHMSVLLGHRGKLCNGSPVSNQQLRSISSDLAFLLIAEWTSHRPKWKCHLIVSQITWRRVPLN